MPSLWFLILVATWGDVVRFVYTQHQQRSGPFRVKLDHLDQCSKDKAGDSEGNFTGVLAVDPLDQSKALLSGVMSMRHAFDDVVVGEVTFKRRTGKGWRKAYGGRFPAACSAARTFFPHIWAEMVRTAGVKNECPFPEGVFHFRNVSIWAHTDAVREFMYGDWQAEAHGLRTGRSFMCVRLYASTVPA